MLLRRLREVAERGTKQVPAPAGDGERQFKHTPGNRERVGLGKNRGLGTFSIQLLGAEAEAAAAPQGDAHEAGR